MKIEIILPDDGGPVKLLYKLSRYLKKLSDSGYPIKCVIDGNAASIGKLIRDNETNTKCHPSEPMK